MSRSQLFQLFGAFQLPRRGQRLPAIGGILFCKLQPQPAVCSGNQNCRHIFTCYFSRAASVSVKLLFEDSHPLWKSLSSALDWMSFLKNGHPICVWRICEEQVSNMRTDCGRDCTKRLRTRASPCFSKDPPGNSVDTILQIASQTSTSLTFPPIHSAHHNNKL
jgi:hypothetical protein